MAYNIGTAYIQVVPSAKGIKSSLGSEFSSAGQAASVSFANSFKNTVMGGAVMGIAATAANKIGSLFSSGLSAGINRVDTMNNFPKIMKNLGYSADEAKNSIQRMSEGVRGLPTSLPTITNLTQQLAPLSKNLGEATTRSLAFNNMLLASGKPAEDQSRAITQFTQALAKGKPDYRDWLTLQEVMPAQLTQVAKSLLGASANSQELGEALKSGKIPMEDFMNEIVKLNESSDGFTGFAEQAKDATNGIGTAMANVENSVARFWQSIIDTAGAENVSGIINGLSGAIDGLAKAIGFVVKNWQAFAIAGGSALVALNVQKIRTGTNAFEKLKGSVGKIAEKFKGVGSASNTATKGVDKVGKAAGSAWKNMLAFGAAVLMIGGGVALAAFGLSALAQSVTSLAAQGPVAVSTMLILTGVIAGLGIAFAIAAPGLSACGTGLLIFGGACLMIGGAVLLLGAGIWLICQGVSVLVQQLPIIVEYGLSASVNLALLGGSLALLSGGLLLAGAGLLVFGAGLLVAGAGALVLGAGLLVASIGLTVAAATIPIIAMFAATAAAGLMLMAASSMMLMASMMILPVQLGLLAVAFGAFAIALGAAMLGIGASMIVFGGFADACKRAGDGMGTAMWAAENLSGAISSMADSARSSIDSFNSQLDNMANHAKSICDQIRASFNTMDLYIPSPRLGAMPHFSLRGAFDLATGQVPSINVDWYAKGGVFSSPSIIGVGDASSKEIVTPEALMADVVDSSLDKSKGVDASIVVNWLAKNLPDIISTSTPVMGEKTFDRKVRKAVAYVS